MTLAGLVLLAASIAVLLAREAGAGPAAQAPATPYYPVKFVCGRVLPGSAESTRLVPADYYTAINVHNPNTVPAVVTKKAVLSPEEPQSGVPSAFVLQNLPPDSAFEVDCPDILSILGPVGPTEPVGGAPGSCTGGVDEDSDGLVDGADPDCFAKGFVILFSAYPLDVDDVETNSIVLTPPDPSGVGQGLDMDVIDAELPPPPPDPVVVNTYSTKYVCGRVELATQVVLGDYRTAVNVHNPHDTEAPLLKKAVIAPTEPLVGFPGPFASFLLPPDSAFEIGCGDILLLLGPTAPGEDGLPAGSCSDGIDNGGDGPIDLDDPDCFSKGFVVIQTHNTLDVVGVNTTTRREDVPGGAQGVGLDIDKEKVEAIDEQGQEIDYFRDSYADVVVRDEFGNPIDQCTLYGPTAIKVAIGNPIAIMPSPEPSFSPEPTLSPEPTPTSTPPPIEYIETEIVSMQLTGTCTSGAPIQLVESPMLPSLGRITEQPGGADIRTVRDQDPLHAFDSFFDVFFEVTVNGVTLHNVQPAPVDTVIPYKPPPPDGGYCGTTLVQLYDHNGNPTPLYVVDRCHFPNGQQPTFQETDINTTGQPANDLHKFFDQPVQGAQVLDPNQCTAGAPPSTNGVGVQCVSPVFPGQSITVQITTAAPAHLLYKCWTLDGTPLPNQDPRCYGS